MNAVGIDVSKGKSTVTIRKPGDVILMSPCDIPHTQSAINDLIKQIKSLEGETKVCMEHTGRYYEPVATWLSDAGIFVSAVNPILIRDFGDDSLRTPKTDKADSKKIARYTLDRWAKLKQYGIMDKTRNQLKLHPIQFYSKHCIISCRSKHTESFNNPEIILRYNIHSHCTYHHHTKRNCCKNAIRTGAFILRSGNNNQNQRYYGQ